eukprot:CAMPEP_0196580678 /NCGR_PEP_ID=MMETSP1081-20130531/30028_1 /TAXON_ID=36882 /ORGANISM="Pyramimonas amylifera, Strain CCMP720" /LENGTH=50 /DNA_ID=CAMNT_0041900619 /DNA_START=1 /DNA_END=150 /DNA_ORIENTATION=-
MLMAERSYAVVMRVCLCLLMEASDDVLQMHDFEDLICYFKQTVPTWDRTR